MRSRLEAHLNVDSTSFLSRDELKLFKNAVKLRFHDVVWSQGQLTTVPQVEMGQSLVYREQHEIVGIIKGKKYIHHLDDSKNTKKINYHARRPNGKLEVTPIPVELIK
jgi:hypothetical protein